MRKQDKTVDLSPRPSSIAHIYFSPLSFSSRMGREVNTALNARLFERICVFGYSEGNPNSKFSVSNEVCSVAIRLLRLRFAPKIISRIIDWMWWTICTTSQLIKLKPAVIQAHSLASMPAACIGMLFSNSSLIYDAHELESQRAGWSKSICFLAFILEKLLIRFAGHVIVVSESIADWYSETYKIARPTVIRNIPDASDISTLDDGSDVVGLRDKLNLGSDDIIFVYLGSIDNGRGIPVLLEAFAKVQPDRHFCAVGYGRYADIVKEYASRHPNIHFHDAVKSSILLPFISSCDVGVSMIEDVCLSYRYCMPNKLFECRHAGLPVMCSNLVEMSKFIEQFGGGWAIEPTVESVIEFVGQLERDQIQRTLASAKPVPRWQDDEVMYRQIIDRAARKPIS